MGRINFIPFARRQQLTIPASASGRPGRGFTRLADMRVGSCLKAHILDAIIYQTGNGGKFGTWGRQINMRMGINGKPYLTNDFYDMRVFQSGHAPLTSCWDWSRDPQLPGRRYPYRLNPGQLVRITMAFNTQDVSGDNQVVPSATFSAAMTKGGGSYQLQTSQAAAPVALPGPQGLTPLYQPPSLLLECPQSSPVDLYSLTVGMWSATITRAVQVLDANESPWWPYPQWTRIIDPLAAPIKLGGYEWTLDPDETITFEFENPETAAQTIDVTIRGVREVEEDFE